MRLRARVLACGVPFVLAGCGAPSTNAPRPYSEPASLASAGNAAAVAPSPVAAALDPQFNWLVNPGFEDADTSDWDSARATAPGHSSGRALALENAKPAWNSVSQRAHFGGNGAARAGAKAAAPAKVTISGWIRTEGVFAGKESWMKARAFVDFAGPDGNQVGGWQSNAVLVEGTTPWTYFEHTYAVPPRAASVKVEIGLPNIVGKVWFDDLALVVLESDGSRRADARPRVHKTDTSDWYAYAPPKSPDGAPLDLSFLNEKPAGQHGHVTAARGHFAFRDGTPVRFWGTNLVGEHAFPTHEVAAATARRLAKLGVNLVRLHHMDAHWAKPNLFEPGANDTQTLSKDSLDRLDYLIAELKKNGIYVYPDLLVHRKYKAGDGVADYEKLEPGAKGVAHFSRRIIELNQAYANALLTHKNPYTGMALAVDPVMVGTEVVNESSIFSGFESKPYPPAYQAELQALYEAQGGKGKVARFSFDWANNRLSAVENAETAAESMRFLADLADRSNAGMKSYLKSIGVKSLLTGSNIGLPIAAEVRANSKMDFIDTHHYWDHPQVWKIGNDWDRLYQAPFDDKPQLRDPGSAAPVRLAMWAVKDKPLLVTEWNDCFPNQYRTEGPMLMGAYASLQDWDGLLQFAYRHGTPGTAKIHPFEIQSSPDNEALFQTAALLFRKRYLAPSAQEVVEPIDDATALAPTSTSRLLFDEPWLPYAARVAKQFTGAQAAKAPALDALRSLHDAQTKTIRSSTGQITWRYGEATLAIDSPKAQGFVGEIGLGDALQAKDVSVTVDPRNPWASVVLVSLDDRPVAESSRLLLAAVARAENSGQSYNMSHTALRDPGRAPVLMQGVKARVLLKSPKGRAVTVKPLDPDGAAGASLEVKAEPGGWSFALSPQEHTALYIVSRN